MAGTIRPANLIKALVAATLQNAPHDYIHTTTGGQQHAFSLDRPLPAGSLGTCPNCGESGQVEKQ